MCINLNPIAVLDHCGTTLYDAIQHLRQKITTIWEHIILAYNEFSRSYPPLKMPEHPTPNPYNQNHKKKDWPNYLDYAWGEWSTNPSDLESTAGLIEPLERITPLHAATLGTHFLGILRLIATRGRSLVDSKDIRGQTPAYWAAYKGNLDALMLLAAYGAKFGEKDYRGKTPIRAAVKYGHVPSITFLALQEGVSINAVDGRGLTLLHLAAFRGNSEVYERLLHLGADPTIKDPLGRTAETILRLRYVERYDSQWFFLRIFSSPTPPPLSLRQWTVDRLRGQVRR